MDFLEREGEMAALGDLLARVERGSGRVVVIGGEAGIGKTRLVDEFSRSIANRVRIAWGACDDLVTPRALGPFRDIAGRIGLDIEFDAGVATAELYGLLLDALATGTRATVAVVEDAHWADAASLDMLKYVGKRVERSRVLLLVTFRNDEVDAHHPLRAALGQIPADSLVRLTLQPLSKSAVARLTEKQPHDANHVYALTRGNPFLVSEVLAAGGDSVPDNVLDSLAARITHLDGEVREVVELVAMVPGRCERSLIETHHPGSEAILTACRERQLLEADHRSVWFRHELARRAVEATMPPLRRRKLHGMITEALARRGADPARIVHHAEQAGLVETLVEFAPLAARQAGSLAAHREAVSHFRRVLPHLGHLPPAEQASILTDYASECYFVDAQAEALDAGEAALRIFRQLGDDLRVGELLSFLSRIHWWLGDRPGAIAAARESISTLERLPVGPALAMSYSCLSQLHMLAHELEPATTWADKAIETAKAVEAPAVLSHALNNLGSARCRAGDLQGRHLLVESYRLARRENLDDHAARAVSNHIWICLENRLYDDAAELLDEGITFAEDRELEGNLNYMTAERAWLHFERGDWQASEADARWVLTRPQSPGITTLPALTTLARLQTRKGDADAPATLEETWSLALGTKELQRLCPIASAKAEYAWLWDETEGLREALLPTWELVDASALPPGGSELAFWMHRVGLLDEVPPGMTGPFSIHAAGDWEAAAALWGQLGCRYEEALALIDSGSEAHLLRALEILDDLGAVPASKRVRRTLRKMGALAVPRGPRPSTRANPAGLTARQVEVLELIAAGLTNVEIAERLFISAKTVDHHVSAILSKMGAPTRREAARRSADWLIGTS